MEHLLAKVNKGTCIHKKNAIFRSGVKINNFEDVICWNNFSFSPGCCKVQELKISY